MQPIGENSLSKVVSNLCKEAGFSGNFKNHSLRASSATRLFQQGVEEQLVAHVTRVATSKPMLTRRFLGTYSLSPGNLSLLIIYYFCFGIILQKFTWWFSFVKKKSKFQPAPLTPLVRNEL